MNIQQFTDKYFYTKYLKNLTNPHNPHEQAIPINKKSKIYPIIPYIDH